MFQSKNIRVKTFRFPFAGLPSPSTRVHTNTHIIDFLNLMQRKTSKQWPFCCCCYSNCNIKKTRQLNIFYFYYFIFLIFHSGRPHHSSANTSALVCVCNVGIFSYVWRIHNIKLKYVCFHYENEQSWKRASEPRQRRILFIIIIVRSVRLAFNYRNDA